jgi:hypothetical protein
MEQATKKFDFKIPEKEANKILMDGFYVRINKGWTATVRSLKDLVNALASGEHEIDLEVFGDITKESNDENLGNFRAYLIEIIAHYKGFASFNSSYKHQFVELSEKNETISIKTANGELITIAVMEGAGCVDIKYHTSDQEKNSNDNKMFKIIGFDGGQTPVPHTDVSLMTILLKPKKPITLK